MELIETILDKEWLECFEVAGIKSKEGSSEEDEGELIIELREKADKVPQHVTGAELESKGFCSPLELVSLNNARRVSLRNYKLCRFF